MEAQVYRRERKVSDFAAYMFNIYIEVTGCYHSGAGFIGLESGAVPVGDCGACQIRVAF